MSDHDVRDVLRSTQNGDGGWAYYAGKASRLEPTCWALLTPSLDADGRGREALSRWPTQKGLLLERAGGTVNVAFHALALLVLTQLGVEHVESNATLASALEKVRGVALGESDINRQDNDLQGWPWFSDTFSWVEPTSWAVVALTRWSARSGGRLEAGRVDEGIRMLLDRVCREGGWNYGNSNMLGTELHPHAPTSALGLLALQTHARDEAVRRSLDWLETNATTERSAMTLALISITLRAYGRPDTFVRASIEDRLPVSIALGNHCSLAAALYALSGADGTSAFTMAPAR